MRKKKVEHLLLERYFTGAIVHAESNGSGGYHPVERKPTLEDIKRHLAGETTLGSYTLRTDNQVIYICWDVDARNLDVAKGLALKLSNYLDGVPHAVEFSGNKGYHITVFFETPVPAEQAKNLGEAIREAIGGPKSGDPHIEVFPKQVRLTDKKPLGNLLKLPLGLHPTSRRRSVFVRTDTWEDGDALDPIEVLSRTTTLAALGSLLERENDPVEQIRTLLAPHFQPGQRHDLTLHLAGYLATLGWAESDVTSLVENLIAECGGDENNLLGAIRDTFQKYVNGERVAGWSGLADLLPGASLRQLGEAAAKHTSNTAMSMIDQIRLSKGPNHLKVRMSAKTALTWLLENGKLVMDDDEIYWLGYHDRTLISHDSREWKTMMVTTFGLNMVESFGRQAESEVYHNAFSQAQAVKIHNRSYWDGQYLWLHMGGPTVWRLDGNPDSRKQFLNGDEGILFRTAGLMTPIPVSDENGRIVRGVDPWQYLVDDIYFQESEEVSATPEQQRELVKAWFLATFFGNVMPTRPILTFVAEPGAGKTTAARRMLRMLEGMETDVATVIPDKPDALRATVASHHVTVLDNIEKSGARWLTDLLNVVATGVQMEIRKLYTSNEVQRIVPDCYLIMTATSLPFSDESVFSRILPVELAKVQNPVPEYVLQRRLQDMLPNLWAGLFDILDQVIVELRKEKEVEAPGDNRLADFTVFCARIQEAPCLNGETLMEGLKNLTSRQQKQLQAVSPFIQALEIWLANHAIEAAKPHTAQELNTTLRQLAKHHQVEWRWETGQALSNHLKALENHLVKGWGLRVKTPATKHEPKTYVFKRATLQVNGKEKPEDDEDGSINLRRNKPL